MSSSPIIERISVVLESTPPFDQLPDEARRELLTDVSIEYFDAGEIIIEHGSTSHPNLYLIESGLVRLMDVMRQRLIGKVGEGEHFGSFGLIKGGTTIYQAKAVMPTVCVQVSGDRFQKLYDTQESFAAHFDGEIRMFVRRMGSATDVSAEYLLFSRNLGQFAHPALVCCEPTSSVEETARTMDDLGVEAIAVVENDALVGILTGADLLRHVATHGWSGPSSVGDLMTSPAVTISMEANLYETMMTMLTRRVRRVVMVESEGSDKPIGILSDRDLAHFRGEDLVATADRIDRASSVTELAGIRPAIHGHLLNLYGQGALPEMLNRTMMQLYDRLVLRVLDLVDQRMREEKFGDGVDLSWAWIRLGSGGRQEMALNSEQHNALVYSDPKSDEEKARAETWFNRIAEYVNDALTEIGFTPSEYVAQDARWRQPISAWKRTYREWILQSDKKSLSPTPMFFDLRCVFGDDTLVDALKEDILDALNVQAMDESRTFLRLMAANAMEFRPPTGLIRMVLDRVSDGRHTFDVVEGGIRPIEAAARVLALELRYLESSNTFDRLRHASDELDDMRKTIDHALEAFQYLVDFRLESQLHAVEMGDPPVNEIDASTLNKMQQRLLRDAFSRAADLQDGLAERYTLHRR
ncbi:MAG: putative nucleotidyltransferase substrate binding domain-containing protein [Rhodothermales bacterium]